MFYLIFCVILPIFTFEMGSIKKPENVCLITAICYENPKVYEAVIAKVISNYGEIALESPKFKFYNTNYYTEEMGHHLEKQFIAFKRFIKPDSLPEIKHKTNDIENEFKIQDKRTVNIDPGYIEMPKLVLATTKNYSHRIYLQNGIYGDIELFWRDGKFNTYPWTYPDYKQDIAILFFTDVRRKYAELIKRGLNHWV